MAYREVRDVDIGEILRRWQGGDSQRQIAAAIGVSRNTVAKYIELAEGAGIGREQPATAAQLASLHAQSQLPGRQRGPNEDLLSRHEAQLQQWVCHDQLQLTRVHELLGQRLGVQVSYKGLYRFVLARDWLPAHLVGQHRDDLFLEGHVEPAIGFDRARDRRRDLILVRHVAGNGRTAVHIARVLHPQAPRREDPYV